MKPNEIKRGDTVLFGGLEVTVMSPCLNSVLICFVDSNGMPKEKYVSYDQLKKQSNDK